MNFWLVDPRRVAMLGFIPTWVDIAQEGESLVDAIDRNYTHGGGWRDAQGFSVEASSGIMSYPCDPDFYPIARYETEFEVLWIYDHSFVTVKNKADETFRTARID